MALTIHHSLKEINKGFIAANIALCIAWTFTITGIFYISNTSIRDRITTTIHGQTLLNVGVDNYDQVIRYISQLETLKLASCLNVFVSNNNETPRLIIHTTDEQCQISWWNIFSSKEMVTIALPNQQVWQISFVYQAEPTTLYYYLIIILTGWALIVTFNVLQRKIRNQKEAALLKDFEVKNSFYIEARKYAHDIRSPLSAFNAIAFSLKATHPDQVALINSALSKISELTDSFLNEIKRKSTPTKTQEQTITLPKLKHLILEEVAQKKIEHDAVKEGNIKIDFEDHFTNTNSHVKIPSEIAIKRIISNITNNAIESIDGTGSVKIQLIESGTTTLISIKDTGSGIPEKIIKSLGKKTVTTKLNGNGFGVYDSSVSLQSIGGKLEFSSTQEGTTFTLKLPILST